MKHGDDSAKLSSASTAISLAIVVHGRKGKQVLDRGVGGSVKKPLRCASSGLLSTNSLNSSRRSTPQMHKPQEPINTLTDLPNWEAKRQKGCWLQPSLAAAGFTTSSRIFFSPMNPERESWPGTREPNHEDRFRVRSHVIGLIWYYRACHA
ncbi:hypothetical protein GGI43DRAFT_2455 [Trichoderma evansii]